MKNSHLNKPAILKTKAIYFVNINLNFELDIQLTPASPRGVSRTSATFKMERFVITVNFYSKAFTSIRSGAPLHTFAQVMSIWHEVHKSKTGQHVFPKLCTYVHKPFSTHLGQKNKNNFYSTSRIKQKLKRTPKFLSFRDILMNCPGRR